MEASHVSRFGPFLNRGLLHSKTLTNRHQCRHTFRIHAARLLQTNPVFHSGFQSCLGFWAAPGRQHHISMEERTAPSKLSASSDAHTHTLTTRTITNANTTLWTAGRSSLQNTLHSDFLALQEDTHGWTARTGKCALMVPVERLASTHQTFVKQTFWEMTEQRFAPERRPGGVCTRGPHSLSNTVAAPSNMIKARARHAMMRRGRNQPAQHLFAMDVIRKNNSWPRWAALFVNRP